jgi:predicted HTH domain antitoxin
MTFTISDEVLQAARTAPDTLRSEIAVLLYHKEKLTLEQAARFALISIEEFQRLLARQALSDYDVDEYRKDIETLKNS